MCDFKEFDFGLKNIYLCCIGGPKMVLKLIQNDPKVVPNGPKWSPPFAPIPIPIPGVSNSLLPGGKTMGKNTCLMIFFGFYKKTRKKLCQWA